MQRRSARGGGGVVAIGGVQRIVLVVPVGGIEWIVGSVAIRWVDRMKDVAVRARTARRSITQPPTFHFSRVTFHA